MCGKIRLNNIRLYSYHGCLEEERFIGSDYLVDIEVAADLSKPSYTDKLSDTVDYVRLYQLIRNEMDIRSKLLEHVAQRIIDRIFAEFEAIEEVEIAVAKINPPIGGDVESVKVVLRRSRP